MAGRVRSGYRGVMPAPRLLRRRLALLALFRAFRRGGPGLGARLASLPRMVVATLRGRYDGGWRLLLMALATVYVISPLDFVPELFTAFLGLIDDAVVTGWLAGALVDETDRFLAWEKERTGKIIPGRTVPKKALPGEVADA